MRAVFLQRNGQDFIYVFDGDEIEFLFRFLGNIDQVFFVELGDYDCGNPGALSRVAAVLDGGT